MSILRKYFVRFLMNISLKTRTTKRIQTFSPSIPRHTLYYAFTHSFFDSIDLLLLSICQNKHSLNSLSLKNHSSVFFHYYSFRIARIDALRDSSRRPSWIEASCRVKSAGTFLTIIGDNCRSFPNGRNVDSRVI